jgi:predicted nucleic acid-binding protein
LDTNVLCRPFDDQTNRRIRRETEAFERILERIRDNEATFVFSEILVFEIQRIISLGKRAKAVGYFHLAKGYHAINQETLSVAAEINERFKLEPRDALHSASALLEGSEYFLTCDDGVTKGFKKRALFVSIRSVRRSMEVVNPVEFVRKMGW